MDVDFTNTTTGATQYLWLFGDGQTDTAISPSHTYTNFGTTDTVYTVTLIASSPFGCADTSMVDITVAPGVQAGFVHNAQPMCAPMDVGFTNTSSGATTYLWDFGDGNTSTAINPQHTYTNTTFFLDIHTVTLTAYSPAGCQSTATQQIMVYPTPDFTFVAQPDSGCSPLAVTFPSVVGAVLYQWDFGDGTTGAGPSPTHTYINATTNDQVFNITLIGENAFPASGGSGGSTTVGAISSATRHACVQAANTIFDASPRAPVSPIWNVGESNTPVCVGRW